MAIIYLLNFYTKIFFPKKTKELDITFATISGVLFCYYIYCLAKGMTVLGLIDSKAMWFEMITFLAIMVSKFSFNKDNGIERLFLILSLSTYQIKIIPALLVFILWIDLFFKMSQQNFGETSKKILTLSLIYSLSILFHFDYTNLAYLYALPTLVFLFGLFEKQKDYTVYAILALISLSLRNINGIPSIIMLGIYLVLSFILYFQKDIVKEAFDRVSPNSLLEKFRVLIKIFFSPRENEFDLISKKTSITSNETQNLETIFRHENTIRSSMILILTVLVIISITYILHFKNLL